MPVFYDFIISKLRFGRDSSDKGVFATPAALNTRWPTGKSGWHAFVESTDTTWAWDSDTSAWVDSGGKGPVTSVFGRAGEVTADAADYATHYTKRSNNLSDVSSAASARSNLGLAGMSVVADAPSDGKQYARKNAAWDEVASTNPDKVFYVSDSGGDYTTIQAALDANTAGGELFLVGPGTYTDDTVHFTANNQTVMGMDALPNKTVVTTADANIVDFGVYAGCKIKLLTIAITAATTAISVVQGSGNLHVYRCRILMTTAYGSAGSQPSCFSGTGTVVMQEGEISYTHTGSVGGGSIKAAIALGAGADYDLDQLLFSVTGSGTAQGITTAYGAGSATIDIDRSRIAVVDSGATAVAAYVTGGTVGGELSYNVIHVTSSTSGQITVGIYGLGTGETRTSYNHLHIVDNGNASSKSYSFYRSAAGSFISHFDDITADDGVYGTAGTITMVSSEHDGQLTIDGYELPASDGNAGEFMQTDGAGVVSFAPVLPVGAVAIFKGTPPSGWLACDGATYLQSAYPLLYAAIGLLPDYAGWAEKAATNLSPWKFAEGNGAILAGGYSTVGRSTDDGDTWSVLASSGYGDNKGLEYISAYTRFIVGGLSGRIYTTDDNGTNWIRRDVDAGDPMDSQQVQCSINVNGTVYLAGDGGKICKTTDGINFTKLTFGVANAILSMAYSSDLAILVASTGTSNVARYCTDGSSWAACTFRAAAGTPEDIFWSDVAKRFYLIGQTYWSISRDGINFAERLATGDSYYAITDLGNQILLGSASGIACVMPAVVPYVQGYVPGFTVMDENQTVKAMFRTAAGSILAAQSGSGAARDVHKLTKYSYNSATSFRVPGPNLENVAFNSYIYAGE